MQQKAPTPAPSRRPEARGPAQTCPNCHALVQDGDIICVACGTNLLTGQKIASGTAPAPSVERGRFPWLVLGIVAIVVLLLAAILYVAYVMTRNPLQQATEMAMLNKDIEAADLLTKHLQKQPGDAQALTLLGKLDWKRARYPEAAASFVKASEADPKDADVAMMAVLALAAQNTGEARAQRIKVLKRVVKDFPENAEARYQLALEQGAANDTEGEIETLKTLLPADVSATLSMGIAQALKGDYDAALDALGKVAQDPDVGANASAALGFAAAKSGKQEDALAALRAAVEKNATSKNEALTRLGMLLLAKGQMEEAQPYLGDAAAADKNNVQAQFFHGVCLQARGLTPEAINAFELVAAKQGPLAIEALVRMGDLQLQQGNQQKAREAIEKAEASGASGAPLSTIRGRLHASLGEDDKAQESFEKALKADQNYAPAHLENGLLKIRQQMVPEGVQELEKYLSLVDAAQQGTRVSEVQAVINHLKQAAAKQPTSASASEERSSTS